MNYQALLCVNKKLIMKKLLLILLCLPMIGFGQDLLLFQDGSKKDVNILEITPSIVKYQKFNSSSKVVYSEDKSILLGVILEDGEFEKFESRRGGSLKKSNFNKGNFGKNMFSFSLINPLVGHVGVGYEHFSKSGKRSFRIPFVFHTGNNDLNNYAKIYLIGYQYKFFPTGSSGGVRGFIGFDEQIGVFETSSSYISSISSDGLIYETINRNYLFFNNTLFSGGVQFHPSELINITLDAGLGLGLYNFKNPTVGAKIGLNLGFRF